MKIYVTIFKDFPNCLRTYPVEILLENNARAKSRWWWHCIYNGAGQHHLCEHIYLLESDDTFVFQINSFLENYYYLPEKVK